MNNNWRIIPELESYAVNEDGIVKALAKTRVNLGNGKQRHYKEYIIKPKYTSRYWYVSLMHNGVKKTYRLHRLVYKAFVGEIPKGMVIDHIDGDRSNNNVDNLRCVTMSTNMQNPNTRYNHSKEVLQINPSTKEVVNRFKNITDAETAMTGKYTPGKQQGHIGSCCRGKRKTAFGYYWQFV